MTLDQNVAIVRRFYNAFISRDTQGLWTLAGEDLMFVVLGRSPLAGTHRGREPLLELFHRAGQAAERSLHMTVHDVIGNDAHVVGLHRVTAVRQGKTLDMNGCTICHVREGVITEIWVGWENQRVFDEFWS